MNRRLPPKPYNAHCRKKTPCAADLVQLSWAWMRHCRPTSNAAGQTAGRPDDSSFGEANSKWSGAVGQGPSPLIKVQTEFTRCSSGSAVATFPYAPTY